FACLVLGYPVARQLARGTSVIRSLGYGLVLSPLLFGIVIRSYGWTILLGNNGLINREPDRQRWSRSRSTAC
ncbi:hypothetical protein ACC731_38670, partial [Rhizobium ruizarguesonis]